MTSWINGTIFEKDGPTETGMFNMRMEWQLVVELIVVVGLFGLLVNEDNIFGFVLDETEVVEMVEEGEFSVHVY